MSDPGSTPADETAERLRGRMLGILRVYLGPEADELLAVCDMPRLRHLSQAWNEVLIADLLQSPQRVLGQIRPTIGQLRELDGMSQEAADAMRSRLLEVQDSLPKHWADMPPEEWRLERV